ncbi:MAG: TonB-dependent receptor [Sphingobacteriales bacterium]|nr:TonB-dependent receptor [Sphingobacteriales bacterium]
MELPGIYNLSNVKSGTTAVLTNKRTDEAINSIFGSAQFGFRDLIFLDITGRNDWASVLPIENNSFFYPSVSLSGILTDLFNIKSDVLSFWKVRASWAKAGSKGILEPYKLIQTYSFREDPWGSTLLPYNPSDLNNPNLFSETTVSTEFGTDMRFFRNRLKVDFTYYDQGNQDLIVPVEVSAASGYIKAYQNVGETNNKGIELQLGVNVIKTKDLNFDITVNYARNKNKVVSLSDWNP